MKKILRKFDTVVASFALVLSVIAANQACALFAHQPKLPDSVRSLRKF
jgi:cyclic lactone autoinducer peptide